MKETLRRDLIDDIARYMLGNTVVIAGGVICWRWKADVLPSRFMPKVAARLWLMVESVGAERLQDITDAGIKAEGIRSDWTSDGGLPSLPEPLLRADFELLWDRLHTRDGHTWHSNPLVWVIRFEREQP